MFFSKQISNLAYNDVVQFCHQEIPADLKIMYAKDLPPDDELAAIIASFANTNGGTIIIGVENENNHPKLPCPGYRYIREANLEQKIANLAHSAIEPPISLEVQECADALELLAFTVVKIPASYDTPHKIDGAIFERSSRSASKFAPVTPKSLRWLRNNRHESMAKRQSCLEEAYHWYDEFYIREYSNEIIGNVPEYPIRSLYVVPLFPGEPLFEYKDAESILRKIQLSDSFGDNFPKLDMSSRSVPGGILFLKSKSDSGYERTCELNENGLFMFRARLNSHQFSTMIMDICRLTCISYRLYKEIKYYGPLKIGYKLDKIKNWNIEPYDSGTADDTASQGSNLDSMILKSLKKSKEITPLILYEDPIGTASEICNSLAWDLGLRPVNQSAIRQTIRKTITNYIPEAKP